MAVSMEVTVGMLRKVLDENKLHYVYDENGKVFILNFALSETKLSTLRILVYVVPEREDETNCYRLTSIATIGISADEESITDVAEFLHRANFGLTFGKFELDFDDGEIRYSISLKCNEVLPTPDAIEDLWHIPMFMVERYGNGLLAVSMGVLSPEEAIEKIEND